MSSVQSKLLSFLTASRYYLPERLLAHFPFDGENALIITVCHVVLCSHIEICPEFQKCVSNLNLWH